MAKYKNQKNLLTSRDTFNKYYGDFRGVDFSSDHTQVADSRLAYAVNMYRDYGSGGGKALETVPGFRRRAESHLKKTINGIHEYRYRDAAPEKSLALTLPAATSWRYREIVEIIQPTPASEGTVEITYAYYVSESGEHMELSAYFTVTEFIPNGSLVTGVLTTDFTTLAPSTVLHVTFSVNGEATVTDVTLTNKIEYRTRATLPTDTEIFEFIRLEKTEGGVFTAEYDDGIGSVTVTSASEIAEQETRFVYREKEYEIYKDILVHRGTELLRWGSFPNDTGLATTDEITLPAKADTAGDVTRYDVQLSRRTYGDVSMPIESVTTADGTDITMTATFNPFRLTIRADVVSAGDTIYVTYTDTHGQMRKEGNYLEADETTDTGDFLINIDYNPMRIISVTKDTVDENGETVTTDLTASVSYTQESVSIYSTAVAEGDTIYVRYRTEYGFDTIYGAWGLPDKKSTSFVMNDKLYLLTGGGYYVYSGGNDFFGVSLEAYIPTTYINTIPAGVNADIGTEYQQRNLLSDYFRQTFIADGQTTEFYLNEKDIGYVVVSLYGEESYDGYTVDKAKGLITFDEAPQKPADAGYPEGWAGIEITVSKPIENFAGTGMSGKSLIGGCTLAAVYDGRVFLSGNPDAPNLIFYCERNADGVADPSYFGVLNYMQDGTTSSRITALLPLADTLAVLKEKSAQDGTVFYHTPTETGNDVQPKIYPSAQGLAGVGCLGGAVNFLDDPVFLSDGGVEAIGQLSVRYERAIEHRSSLVDAKLLQLDIARAQTLEWNGYLCIYEDGKIFLADSRQRYTDEYGNAQYEWYYLEDIGLWEGQYTEYTYAERVPTGLEGKKVKYCTACGKGEKECTCEGEDGWIEIPLVAAEAVYDAVLDETHDLRGKTANAPDENGEATKTVYRTTLTYSNEDLEYPVDIYYTVHDVCDRATLAHVRYEAHLCQTRGAQTGGTFHPATVLKVIDGHLYFGTDDGGICMFNTDKRDENGEIAPEWYTFDGRTIFAGCATRMDNCGIPHLTKSTVKRSTVIKTKTFADSAAKIKVRTNKKAYAQIARINSKRFVFDSMDFSDFSFETTDQTLFSVKEKEKKWIEKQYYIYTDEFKKPFALYYVCYRYSVAGRFKE